VILSLGNSISESCIQNKGPIEEGEALDAYCFGEYRFRRDDPLGVDSNDCSM
jgi:hypothetical protein